MRHAPCLVFQLAEVARWLGVRNPADVRQDLVDRCDEQRPWFFRLEREALHAAIRGLLHAFN